MREMPHRLPREAYRGQVTVFITVCVEGGKPLFMDASVPAVFVEFLGAAAERWACLVPVYCFMPNHLHVILCGQKPDADVWKAVVDFKQKSGFWLRRHKPEVSWQKDFYDHVVRQSEDLVGHVRYILDNPCRKGLVSTWEDYRLKGSLGCELKDVLAGLPLSRRTTRL